MVQWEKKDVTHLFSQKKEIPSSFPPPPQKKRRRRRIASLEQCQTKFHFMDKALFPVFSLLNNDFFFWQVNQISINLTTNERINKKRYVYLRGPSGIFLNPFDRGCLKNWLEYFHWVEPYDKKPNLMYNVWSIILGSTGMWLGMIT